MSQLECGTCKFAFMEKDRHDEVQIECRRHPPILFNSGSLAKFPKILPLSGVEPPSPIERFNM